MDKIKIYARDGVTAVTLPRCRPSLALEDVTVSATMASGKLVEDVIGVRQVLTASYGYVPASDIVTLNQIAREGGFHRVQAPGVGGDIDADFKLSPPSYEVFKYVNGAPMWANVTVKLTAREVVKA
ncbi:hypothetical protein AAAT94_07645 [Intestinimonas aquisgranensis]|nr:hypothetical protein [Intestinimonas aquisgranensis]